MTAPDTRERRPEKAIEADIIRALRSLGFDVTKTSASLHAKGVSAGTPDLYVRSHRWKVRLFVEVKTPRGKLSALQEIWHGYEKLSGGDVVVVRSVSDVVAALRERGVPIQ